MEWGEIASHDGADAAGAVGAELHDAADDDGFGGEEEFVVAVDGVDQVCPNGLSVAQGKMVVDTQGERCFRGKSPAFGLA